jgi:hypothetical protein
MQNAEAVFCRASRVQHHGNYRVAWLTCLVLWLVGTIGCGPMGQGLSSAEEALEVEREALDSINGLSVNGLSVNGLSVNGLSVNGLSVNGLSSLSFQSWFEADPHKYAAVMKYMVTCAVPDGQTRTYVSPITGESYTWVGRFGLAPDWSAGLPPSLAEQQIITACLAAHANKFGRHVDISILGKNAHDVEIPYTSEELATFSEKEACFFGNIFNGEGSFAANNRTSWLPSQSTTRGCGLSSNSSTPECSPMVHVGSCQDFCRLDASGTYYTQCTYNGVTYKPITTYIRPAEIHTCGDGICQFTEKCGTGNSYDNCSLDCGACAP